MQKYSKLGENVNSRFLHKIYESLIVVITIRTILTMIPTIKPIAATTKIIVTIILKTWGALEKGTTSKLKGNTLRKLNMTARLKTCRTIEIPCCRRYLSKTIKIPLPSIDRIRAILRIGKTAPNS